MANLEEINRKNLKRARNKIELEYLQRVEKLKSSQPESRTSTSPTSEE